MHEAARDRDSTGVGLRVLQSTPAPGPQTNPYVTQLHRCVRATGAEVLTFSWRTALLGRYDVMHTHWPEILVRGSSPLRAAVRQLLTALLTLRLALTQVPVVRTVHNLAPHEPVTGRAKKVLGALEAREQGWVRLSSTTPTSDSSRTSTVLHGHYRDWFATYRRSDPLAGLVVVPGVVRAYKGLDELAAALPLLEHPGVVVHVVGRVEDPGLGARLTHLAAREPRLRLTLRHVTDAELVAMVTEAQLVALPYRSMHNSAALLLALSLDRPALVPHGPTTEELAAEVGHDWVLSADMTSPEALASALDEALARTTSPPPAPPDLSRREWTAAGRAHVAAYRQALTLARSRQRRRTR